MNKLKTLIILAFLVPQLTFGATAVGWNTPTITTGWIVPNMVNGVNQVINAIAGIFTSASSTFAGPVRFPSLADGCLFTSSFVLSSTGSPCGAGSGGASKWATSTTDALAIYPAGAQRVGISTSTPTAKLMVTDGNFIVTGDIGTGENLVIGGNGSRFMWLPKKPAFVASWIDNGLGYLDDANIGDYSINMGSNTECSGTSCVAIGNEVHATDDSAVALGSFSTASGALSFAFGSGNTASGGESTAIGNNTVAGGDNSFAIGLSPDPTLPLPIVSGDNSLGIFMGSQTGIDITAPNVMSLMGGSLGVGTTTPGSLLSIGNLGGINFIPTATSTFGSSANGINITNGCYAINGNCLTQNAGTVTSVGLSDTNSTLTIGGTPVTTSGTLTATLNLGHTNTWSVLQNFNYSSSTIYSSFLNASSTFYFGAGLTTCNSASSALTWTAGVFGCNTITTGLTSYDAWTHPAAGISATTSQVTVAGLLSTASSTFSSALRLTSLSQGVTYVGSTGLVGTTATGTITCSGTGVSCTTTGLSVLGGNLTITGSGLTSYDAWTPHWSLGYSATTSAIGIGTTTPRWQLQVSSSTAPQLTLTSSLNEAGWAQRSIGGNLYFATTSPTTFATSTNAITMTSAIPGSAGLLIGTSTAGSTGLSVVGTVFAHTLTTAAGTPSSICQNATTKEITVNAALTCTVSARDQKSNIESLNFNALDKIMALKPSSFYYKDNLERERWGFIADEVQSVSPMLGDAYDNGNARSIDLPALIALNTKAIQELAVMKGAVRSAEENWQNILIGLLILYVLYNEYDKRKG